MTIATDAGTSRQFVKGEKPDVSASEFGRLKRAKAAVLAGAETSEPVEGNQGGDKGESLDDMTKAELLAYAEANQIEVDPKAAKAVVLATIKAAAE
ncbi:hypothetical protein LCM4579_00005 [Ensifer sp. LCM 4579]|nr:hypothetical protein LCM4579_00005 [Ensifer sp. LCM 4579]